MNIVVIIGNITARPDMRFTPNGVKVATFSVAVDRPYTNADGSRDTDFLRVVAFGKLAENIEKYTEKGSKIAVTGRLETRSYTDKQGVKRQVWEIVADKVEFLTWKKQEEVSYQYPTIKQRRTDDEFSNDDLPF